MKNLTFLAGCLFILALLLQAVSGPVSLLAQEVNVCPRTGHDPILTESLSCSYHANGRLERENPIENGKSEGLTKTYYENGELESEIPYQDGQAEGLGKFYTDNGRLESEVLYNAGKREGITKTYYESGALKGEKAYKNGKVEGLAKSYYENGKLESEVPYKNDQREGLGKFYYESGKLEFEIPYQDDKPESPGNGKPGWYRVYIEDMGSIDLPPTMEVQGGLFKKVFDEIIESHGIVVSKFLAQPKGLNEWTEDGFNRFVQVMVDSELGKLGDFEQLNFNIHEYKKSDIAEFDAIAKEQIQQRLLFAFPKLGLGEVKLIEWHPLKLESINGMSCFHISYIWQRNHNPSILVHLYHFPNNDRLHKLMLSCLVSDSDYWQADFAEILKSFRIYNQ